MNFTCPKCAHEAEWVGPDAPTDCVLRCEECKSRIAFGMLMPRIVVQPASDPRFREVHFGDVIVTLDGDLAAMLAQNILSIHGR